MPTTAQTATEALDLYKTFLAEDRLIQNRWYAERDGRQLACALGVLGDDMDSASDCPAQVMPEWLAQCVLYFFDALPFDDAKAWGLAFYEQIARLNGDVPFRVYHRWMAECVLPLAAESARQIEGGDDAVTANETMIALHTRARDGDMPSETERSAAWLAAWSAARSAAWSAAWSAASSAARSAAVKTLSAGLIAALKVEA